MEKLSQELAQFTGTEAYHKISMGRLKVTDGVKYLAEKASCFWLFDIVSSVQYMDKILKNPFIIWRVINTKTTSGCYVKAYTDCEEDGSYSDSKLLYKQKIGYTTFFKNTGFKEPFEFYQSNGIILLKNEY